MTKASDAMDCARCEQRVLALDRPGDARLDPCLRAHLDRCEACRSLAEALGEVKTSLDAYRVEDPGEELLQRVMKGAGELQAARPIPVAREVKGGELARVLVAGLCVLPVVLVLDSLIGWALYEVSASLLPRTLALYCTGLFVAWASLAVSLSYASLPLLTLLPRAGPGRAA